VPGRIPSRRYRGAAIARLDPSNRLLLLLPACIGIAGVLGPMAAGFLKTTDSYLPIFRFAVVCMLVPGAVFYRLMSPKAAPVAPALSDRP
jgi:hypothetical protein